jgi:hypothetical protein
MRLGGPLEPVWTTWLKKDSQPLSELEAQTMSKMNTSTPLHVCQKENGNRETKSGMNEERK